MLMMRSKVRSPACSAIEPAGTPSTGAVACALMPNMPRRVFSMGFDSSTVTTGSSWKVSSLSPRFTVTGMAEVAPAMASEISSKRTISTPLTRVIRSPGLMPAIAAGMSGATPPTRGVRYVVSPSSAKKYANTGKMRLKAGPADMMIARFHQGAAYSPRARSGSSRSCSSPG